MVAILLDKPDIWSILCYLREQIVKTMHIILNACEEFRIFIFAALFYDTLYFVLYV